MICIVCGRVYVDLASMICNRCRKHQTHLIIKQSRTDRRQRRIAHAHA